MNIAGKTIKLVKKIASKPRLPHMEGYVLMFTDGTSHIFFHEDRNDILHSVEGTNFDFSNTTSFVVNRE